MRVGGTQKPGFKNSSKSEFRDLCPPSSPSIRQRRGEEGVWRRDQTMGLVPKKPHEHIQGQTDTGMVGERGI